MKKRILFFGVICFLFILLILYKKFSGSSNNSILAFKGKLVQNESNDFVTYFPGKDMYYILIKEDWIYTAGADGVFLLSKEDFHAKMIPIKYSYALAVKENRIIIGSDTGIAEFEKDCRIRSELDNQLKDRHVRVIFTDKEDKIWVGTFLGAVCEDGRILDQKNGLISDMVNFMLHTSDGSLWLGSYVAPQGGISVYKGGKTDTFPNPAHRNITAMVELSKDYVLTGGGIYDKGGGNLFKKTKDGWEIIQEISKKDGLPGEKIRSLYLDQSGHLWIGTEYDGLGIYDIEYKDGNILLKPLIFLKKKDGLADDEIKMIKEDELNYYIGTFGGLSVISKDKLWEKIAE